MGGLVFGGCIFVSSGVDYWGNDDYEITGLLVSVVQKFNGINGAKPKFKNWSAFFDRLLGWCPLIDFIFMTSACLFIFLLVAKRIVACTQLYFLYLSCSAPVGQITCGKPILRSLMPSLCCTHLQKHQKNVWRALKKGNLNMASSSTQYGFHGYCKCKWKWQFY